MADLSILDKLIERGATRVTFHADGQLESVEFGPIASSTDDTQHEAPKDPTKRARSVGGLTPRALDGS